MLKELTFSIPGGKFPVSIGGTWRLVDKIRKDSLLKIAKEDNANIYDSMFNFTAVYETSEMNELHGFGLFSEVEKKSRSLAMLLASSLSPDESIIYVFDLFGEHEGYNWVCIIERGMVQSNGDAFCSKNDSFEREDEAKAENPEAEYKRFNSEETKAFLINLVETASPKAIKNARIISFQGLQKRFMLLLFSLLFIIVISLFGFNMWKQKIADNEKVEARLKLEREARTKTESLKKSAYPPVWLNEPYPSDIVKLVENRINDLKLAHNGWKMSGVQYSKNRIRTIYTRDQSSVYLPPPGIIPDVKKPFVSTVTEPVSFEKKVRENGILSRKSAEAWLMESSIGKHFKTTFSLKKIESKEVEVVKGQRITIVASYQKMDIVFSDIRSLKGFDNLLSVPGMVIDSIFYANGSWTIKGVLYVLP